MIEVGRGTPADGEFASNYPGLSYGVLPGPATKEQAPAYLYLTDWSIERISCRGPSGWWLATTYANPDNGDYDPLEGELFLFRLAQHRPSGEGHWQQPRASFSTEGRHVIFDSDWNSGGPLVSPQRT